MPKLEISEVVSQEEEDDFVVVSPQAAETTKSFGDVPSEKKSDVEDVTTKVKALLAQKRSEKKTEAKEDLSMHLRDMEAQEKADRETAYARAKRSDREHALFVEASLPKNDVHLAEQVWDELLEEERSKISVFKRRKELNRTKGAKLFKKKKKKHLDTHVFASPDASLPTKATVESSWNELQAIEESQLASFKARLGTLKPTTTSTTSS